MVTEFSVDGVAPDHKARFWSDAITSVFFPLNANPREPGRFGANLCNWNLGDVSLTRIRSGSIEYFRERAHLLADKEEHLLITFNGLSEVHFEQDRLSLTCRPRQFFIEMAHLPYVFSQLAPNDLWVLRIKASLLRWHVGSVERFVPYAFDAEQGVGALLFDLLRLTPQRLDEAACGDPGRIGASIVELLALTLEQDERVLASDHSSIQTAHLVRIGRHIRRRLSDPALSPDGIAAACGISTRYLHQLFRASGTSVRQWIREQRLLACDRELRQSGHRSSIAELAYRWGFSDHAQFCRHYRSQFGCTPTEARAGVAPRRATANALALI